MTADEIQTRNQAKLKRAYDYIIIGSGASGAVIAGELSKTGAEQDPGSDGARVRRAGERAGWALRAHHRYRAGTGQDRPRQPRLQHPTPRQPGADGRRMRAEPARSVPKGRRAGKG